MLYQQICKDKYEAEIWFVALRALISRGNFQRWTSEIRIGGTLSECSSNHTERHSQSIQSNSSSDAAHEVICYGISEGLNICYTSDSWPYFFSQDIQNYQITDSPFEKSPKRRLGRAFSDVVLHKAAYLCSPQRDSVFCSGSAEPDKDVRARNSADTFRFSFSSAISTSSLESSPGDIPLSSIFMWGEGIEDGPLDGVMPRIGNSSPGKDAYSPKVLESVSALDAQDIACGSEHAVLISSQGQVFSWGNGSGGKLGHGLEADIYNPKLIDVLGELTVVSIGCGEYHTCAVTVTGDLYTWGDGVHNFGLLGHGTEFSYWAPRKVRGQMEGICVTSVSCGPWHSAAITSLGRVFTFGDGTFGALGHGDRCSTSVPREVENLKRCKTVKISCGFWHTAAVVECHSDSQRCSNTLIGKLFTWGNGDEGQLGLGDKLCQLVPTCVAMPNDRNFCQVACGHSITVALTICGRVYAMGSTGCGEQKCKGNSNTLPINIEGKIKDCFITEISCGSHHVAALSSMSEVFTWGKGRNGQLGHGDNADRNSPTLVKALERKQVKRVICGSNFTAAICLHVWVCAADYSTCSGCRNPFNFKRRRHNCYNCGLFFCKECTHKKSMHASLAPNVDKLYRVCEDCFSKLNKGLGGKMNARPPKYSSLCGDPRKEEKIQSFKPKQYGLLSRLSSFDSFKTSNTQLSMKSQKLCLSSSHSSPVHEGNFGCHRSSASSPSIFTFDSGEQGFKVHSTSSPVSTKSSPHSLLLQPSFHGVSCNEEVSDNSKQANDGLTDEISFLREQVHHFLAKIEILYL